MNPFKDEIVMVKIEKGMVIYREKLPRHVLKSKKKPLLQQNYCLII
jgi:hypothetical protein